MEDRLVELEIRYTHVERQLEELGGVVFEQQKTIAALAQQLKELRAAVAISGERQPNERPPHY